jgi:hypothetical protein
MTRIKIEVNDCYVELDFESQAEALFALTEMASFIRELGPTVAFRRLKKIHADVVAERNAASL